MFEMIDYRANKLYVFLMIVPSLFFIIFQLIGIPLLTYYLSYEIASNLFIILLIAIVISLLLDGLFLFIFKFLVETPIKFLFKILIDIKPHHNRNQEQAERVAFEGGNAIAEFMLEKHPKFWDMDELAKFQNSISMASFFFGSKITERWKAVKEHFIDVEDDDYSFDLALEYLEEYHPVGVIELILSTPMYRKSLVTVLLIIYLVFFNPMNF